MKLFKNQEAYAGIITNALIIVIIVAFFIAVAFVWKEIDSSRVVDNQYGKLSLPNQNANQDDKTVDNVNNFQEWAVYEHPILGLKFEYKKEWGDPATAPYNNITNLATVNEKFFGENPYVNSVSISFAKQGPSIQIFNDNYKGELYPNARAYQYGPIDNFSTLKNAVNICDYKINFPNNPSGTGIIVEGYSECVSNVKTALLKDTKFFSSVGIKYQYNVTHYGFKKLENGYLDNLLAKFIVGYTRQIDNADVSFDNFFDNELIRHGTTTLALISAQKYEQDKEDFSRFVNSIKAFKPEERKIQLTEISKNDSADIVLIKQYYNHIVKGELSEAYNMYLKKDVSFDEYNSWYKSVILASPRDFKNINGHTYRFYVDYQDGNMAPQVYRVTMDINSGKISFVSSEEIISKEVIFNEIKAFVKIVNNYTYVILVKDGWEIEVDKTEHGSEMSIMFANPTFSPDGKYLIYGANGWEGSAIRVYDIVGNKKVSTNFNAARDYGFSKDNNYFYVCANSEMSGDRYVNIYSLPNFILRKSDDDLGVFNDFKNKPLNSLSCKMDLDKNILHISVSSYEDYNGKNTFFGFLYDYNFDDKTVIKY